MTSLPPQMIISLPVQSAVCTNRAVGASTVLVGVQLSMIGLYQHPVFSLQLSQQPPPPHTIISLPVQSALWPRRAVGAFTTVVGVQLSMTHSKEEISGSSYVSDVRALAAASACAPPYAPRLPTSRSARIGLARHSAMTKGSLPSDSNSSAKTSGSLV